jgi:hypothetical protein
VPVDSEHSALAQALRGGRRDEVRRLVITATGGPFRGWPRSALADVTPAQALAHPRWSMGPLVTTNSATLVNKGLEVIEAHLLFDVPFDAIEVMVHPQAIIHSMVEFYDGSTIAQTGLPDMRLPIALGLAWPDRVPRRRTGLDWTAAHTWELFPLDREAFPAGRPGRARRPDRRQRAGGLQRRQRGLRARVPRRPAAVPRDRRHRPARRRRADVLRRRHRREILAADARARTRAREVTTSPSPDGSATSRAEAAPGRDATAGFGVGTREEDPVEFATPPLAAGRSRAAAAAGRRCGAGADRPGIWLGPTRVASRARTAGRHLVRAPRPLRLLYEVDQPIERSRRRRRHRARRRRRR